DRHSMNEFTPELGVFRIAGIVEPGNPNSSFFKDFFIYIVFFRGARYLLCATRLSTKRSQTLCLSFH
ncbi:hypothetical protein, partial [Rhizobium johnstonii]|uniref:hypothetical protein n=1 Tax=Rhizobium johnstonii TaxID=3019933 RepID=UPI003F9CC19B